MKPIQIKNSKRNKSIIASLAVIAIAGSLFFSLSPSSGILSLFNTNTSITAQNAASQWTGGSDNSYRSKLSPNYVAKLDALTLAILRKGSNMTDAQFKVYLSNLSGGVAGLGTKPEYSNDTDVRNILGFLVHEVNGTITALNTNTAANNAIGELAGLINNTPNTSTTSQPPVTNTLATTTSSITTTNPVTNPTIPTTTTSQEEVSDTPACGSANRKTFLSPPSGLELCSGKGVTASAVYPDGTSAYGWTCKGSNNSQQSCFAYNGNGKVNLVNGGGIAACNKQIFDNYGTQKYTCSIGGGCAKNGLPGSPSNPSANPHHAGACIQVSDWNKMGAN